MPGMTASSGFGTSPRSSINGRNRSSAPMRRRTRKRSPRRRVTRHGLGDGGGGRSVALDDHLVEEADGQPGGDERHAVGSTHDGSVDVRRHERERPDQVLVLAGGQGGVIHARVEPPAVRSRGPWPAPDDRREAGRRRARPRGPARRTGLAGIVSSGRKVRKRTFLSLRWAPSSTCSGIGHRDAVLEAQVDVDRLRRDEGEVRRPAADRQVVADELPARTGRARWHPARPA